jgi:hypothetical protein
VLLAEELALVSLNPETGRHGAGLREVMNACLSGLLVTELMIDGVAACGEKQGTVVLTGRVTSSRTLAAAAEVVAERGPKLKTVLSSMNRGLNRRVGTGTWDTAMAGLIDAGVVGSKSGGVRGGRFPVLDPDARGNVVARLRAAAASDAPLHLREAAVLSMIGPARLLEVVAPDRATRRQARRRIDHALDNTDEAVVGTAVRRVIADAAAAAGAATVVVIASTT